LFLFVDHEVKIFECTCHELDGILSKSVEPCDQRERHGVCQWISIPDERPAIARRGLPHDPFLCSEHHAVYVWRNCLLENRLAGKPAESLVSELWSCLHHPGGLVSYLLANVALQQRFASRLALDALGTERWVIVQLPMPRTLAAIAGS